MGLLVTALKESGTLKSQDGQFGSKPGQEYTEAILAGLRYEDGVGFVKPPQQAQSSIPLKFGSRKKLAQPSIAGNGEEPSTHMVPKAGKRKSQDISGGSLAGVGLVNSSESTENSEGDASDDDLIDEDTLLTEEDLQRPVKIPVECQPKTGKRRRACKDCTCGLAQQLEAKEAARRADADTALDTLKLDGSELAEVDFTVKGKVGSCGNCSLGDAFRCDGCPYIGLPPFKPGEVVRLVNDEVQL